jgi:fido (protein-threonine AMPylation protein)
MPTVQPFHVRLGEALARVREKTLVNQIVRSKDIKRADRALLIEQKWLTPIAAGYLYLAKPEAAHDSTVLQTQIFWPFLSQYMKDLAGDNYCASAQNSLDLQTGRDTAPKQMVLLTKTTGNNQLQLDNGPSILWYKNVADFPARKDVIKGVNVMPLDIALSRLGPRDFTNCRDEVVMAMRMVSFETLLKTLLEKPVLDKAGRLASVYRAMGWNNEADRLLKTFKAAGYDAIREEDIDVPPFRTPLVPVKSSRAERLRVLWNRMREPIIEELRDVPREPQITIEDYLKRTESIYVADAYHSLSIEGYHVTEDLIKKVMAGSWNPDQDAADAKEVDALAAKGYHEAFQAVQKSIVQIFAGEDAGVVLQKNLSDWHQAMFSPSVKAGIISASDLSGYRNKEVFLRGSTLATPSKDALMDCMEAYFDLVKNETSSEVRAVLGHFIFTYIHPYSDGNGRLGRFIMNMMLASDRIPWTVITIQTRKPYLAALEKASRDEDILPFAQFLRQQIDSSIATLK